MTQANRLCDDVAVVVGGANGIGAAITQALIDAGARVAVVDVDLAAAKQLAAGFGGRAIAIQADVSSDAEVGAMISEAAAHFGRVTVAVHCANPRQPQTLALETPLEAWRSTMDVVLMGGFLLARHFAEQVMRQGGGGRIINITSGVVERPRVKSAAYCSAKSGLTGLTKVLAMELGPHGINVNAVGPGLTETAHLVATMTPAYKENYLQQVPKHRIGQPSDIADAVVFLASPAADYLTGQSLYVDGGYTAGSLLSQG
jgi:NAD(P)-dependent dehydrogenase (short-subunit alcohol dehydrogenase family)